MSKELAKKLDELQTHVVQSVGTRLEEHRERLDKLEARLDALEPHDTRDEPPPETPADQPPTEPEARKGKKGGHGKT